MAIVDDSDQFRRAVSEEIQSQGKNSDLQKKTMDWFLAAGEARYSYHFEAFGRPIIQFPQDMIAVQELIWTVRPDLIIETGIARGGSLIWSAGLLALLEYADAAEAGTTVDPRNPHRKVLGIDIDIRSHNRAAIESHPLIHHVEMIQGSSIAPEIVEQVKNRAVNFSNVMVLLDSNHTHEHVLAELEAYAPLVSQGSYCVVFDTMIEDAPPAAVGERPWGPGNSPKTAVNHYLARHSEFSRDDEVQNKILITVAPGGYLRRL